ncbi:MAG: glycosyltransferase [Chlamydiales bacterium]
MRIVYPYNEILPKNRAHDLYIFDECAALANIGFDVSLLCGKGGMKNQDLFKHYSVSKDTFNIKRIPIIRKNHLFKFSWNALFFFLSQRVIKQIKPHWVFLSVYKQGIYHLKHKIPNTRYVYEVHELTFYPYMKTLPNLFFREKEMLNRADLITVTTQALKEILLAPPYDQLLPIEVVPLAVKKTPLAFPIKHSDKLMITYIGQLYPEQGVENLIRAIEPIEGIHLKIIGGEANEILDMKKIVTHLNISHKVDFLGFISPDLLSEIATEADVFVAPFHPLGRMPYVAHMKLYEYAKWGRPIVAPNLPIVREHFNRGLLFFEPGKIDSLSDCIEKLKEKTLRDKLQKEISLYRDQFNWQSRAMHYQDLLR